MTELNYVLNRMHALLWPDLIVLCGGITADHPNPDDDLKVPTQDQAGRAARRCRHRRRARSPPRSPQGVWINQAKAAGEYSRSARQIARRLARELLERAIERRLRTEARVHADREDRLRRRTFT